MLNSSITNAVELATDQIGQELDPVVDTKISQGDVAPQQEGCDEDNDGTVAQLGLGWPNCLLQFRRCFTEEYSGFAEWIRHDPCELNSWFWDLETRT